MSDLLKPILPTISEGDKFKAAYHLVFNAQEKWRQNEIKTNPDSRFCKSFWGEVAAFAENPENLTVLTEFIRPPIKNELKVEEPKLTNPAWQKQKLWYKG